MTYDELGKAPIGFVVGSLRAHAADRTLRSGATVRVFPCISDEFQVARASRVRFLGLGPLLWETSTSPDSSIVAAGCETQLSWTYHLI